MNENINSLNPVSGIATMLQGQISPLSALLTMLESSIELHVNQYHNSPVKPQAVANVLADFFQEHGKLEAAEVCGMSNWSYFLNSEGIPVYTLVYRHVRYMAQRVADAIIEATNVVKLENKSKDSV